MYVRHHNPFFFQIFVAFSEASMKQIKVPIFTGPSKWSEPGHCQNSLFIIIQRISKKWHTNKPKLCNYIAL